MQSSTTSPEESELLAAIERSPDADGPCLKYADWLQRQGGEANCTRAEFIQIQCAKPSELREELLRRRRQADLMPKVSRMMLGPLAELESLTDLLSRRGPVSGPRLRMDFRRGFLRNLELDAALFSLIAEVVFSIRPQTSVAVTRVGQFLAVFCACPYRKLVTSLQFRHYPDPGASNHDEFIRSLISDGPWGALTTLDLRHCHVSNRELRFIIDSEQLPKLTELNLTGARLDHHILRYLTQSEIWPRLRRLSWAENYCGNDGTETLLAAAASSHLQLLSVRNCGIGPEHLKLLQAAYGSCLRLDKPDWD